MAEPDTVLDRLLVEAFEVATRDGRDDVADHVLNALECLCGGSESGGAREIYRIICDEKNLRAKVMKQRTKKPTH